MKKKRPLSKIIKRSLLFRSNTKIQFPCALLYQSTVFDIIQKFPLIKLFKKISTYIYIYIYIHTYIYILVQGYAVFANTVKLGNYNKCPLGE